MGQTDSRVARGERQRGGAQGADSNSRGRQTETQADEHHDTDQGHNAQGHNDGVTNMENVTPGTDGGGPGPIGTGAREAPPIDVTDRLRREGRWAEAEPRKNQLIREYHASGLTRAKAKLAAYAEIARLYPPMTAANPPSEIAAPALESAGLSGLGDIPADWPDLPDNAALAVEVSWVQANRVRVRQGDSVDLSRARSPAPSWAALSWLETSVLFPSKWADIVAKATSTQADERESVRRERLAIEEVRSLLAEMIEARDDVAT